MDMRFRQKNIEVKEYTMPIELKEIIRFIKDLGYEIESEVADKSVVDEPFRSL
ncbi:hypothetical protein J7L18_09485 [Candidatus Bathyarchaeota archaeon]|nr:hypothetical protein [Candidatus Bathyarchaeota archaeon]